MMDGGSADAIKLFSARYFFLGTILCVLAFVCKCRNGHVFARHEGGGRLTFTHVFSARH